MIVDGYPDYAIYHTSSYGPTFGRGQDLLIVDNCDKITNCQSNLGRTYQTPAGYTYNTVQAQSLLAGSYVFKVDEYEVFYQP